MAIIMARGGRARNVRRFGAAAALLAALAVSACGGSGRPETGPIAQGPAASAPAAANPRVDPSAPARVALLAPLTAADPAAADEARGIADAARLAAEERPGAVQLDVRDTGGTAGGAQAAARGAVDAGAALILGPLFGANAGPAAAAAPGVNVISFSNTTSVAAPGIWVSGLLAQSEAERILGHAAGQGLRLVGLYHPQGAAGDAAREGAQDAARRTGVRLSPVIAYPRSFEGIQDTAEGYAEAHRAEGAQAVLLADTGQGLQAAASFLNYHDVSSRNAQLLGLSGWQSPATLTENALRGGRFAGPDPDRLAAFAERFRARYGRAPGALSFLGYDAVAAAAEMARAGRARGDASPFGPEDITDPGGFEGAAGPFRFTRDGLNERALAVIQVGDEGFVTVEPAPVAFGRPGA